MSLIYRAQHVQLCLLQQKANQSILNINGFPCIRIICFTVYLKYWEFVQNGNDWLCNTYILLCQRIIENNDLDVLRKQTWLFCILTKNLVVISAYLRKFSPNVLLSIVDFSFATFLRELQIHERWPYCTLWESFNMYVEFNLFHICENMSETYWIKFTYQKAW